MAKNKPFTGKTVIAAILDRSGSMAPLINDMIGGYNTWLDSQKKLEGEATITTTIFDTVFDVIEGPNTPVADAKHLTRDVYFARNGTALNDAIGQTVSAMEVGKKDRALVLIITDGQENSSREWSSAQVKKLIAEREAEKNWTFAYLSAAPTGWTDADKYAVMRGNTQVVLPTARAVQGAWTNITTSSQSYRSGMSGQSVSFFREEETTEPKAKAPTP